jgi:hypothetical protein
MIYLYLKTHNITKKKYLGKTVKNPYKYSGSGTYWREHLRRYGNDVTTKILFETESKEELVKKALQYSNLWDVANNPEFANTIPEMGDGGDTSQSPAYQKYLNEVHKNPNSQINKIVSKRMREENPMHNREIVKKVFSAENIKKRAMGKVGKKCSDEHKNSVRMANLGVKVVTNGTQKKRIKPGTEVPQGFWYISPP